MTVKVKVTGARRLQRRFAALSEELTAGLGQALLEGAEAVRDEAVRSITSEPKSGRLSATAGGAARHRASAPGQPPAAQTGRLAASIEARRGPGLSATVGVHDRAVAEYAEHLEFGTRRMAARPWLVPALERARGDIRRRIEDAVGRALAKAESRAGR